jgi:hypothetical protein
MLKRLRLKFMVMASLMLAIIGFGLNGVKAQEKICNGIPFNPGWIDLGVKTKSDFTAGLLGTIESFNGSSIAGLDWLYNNDSFLNTTVVGSQLISWWTRKNGRDSIIQVLNTNDQSGVKVHVQIIGEDCSEITDFCDSYTPDDTVIYDLANLVTNAGQSIATGALAGHEGVIVITPVNNCPNGRKAIRFNFLQGNLRVTNAGADEYGTNVYARTAQGVCIAGTTTTTSTCTFDSDCLTNTCVSSKCSISGDTCSTDADCPTTSCGSSSSCNTLDGTAGCKLNRIVPSDLNGNFATLPGSAGAGADLILISLNDSYRPSYSAVAGTATYSPGIFDDQENFQSCPGLSACFTRLGIDDPFPISENFSPVVTPSPSPTPIACTKNSDCPSGFVCLLPTPSGGTPAPGVCVPAPTTSPTPTKKPSGGGGGGCSIGGPAEVGTAMANVLVPLVPAFAIGFRVLRRKSRKNQK